MERRFLRLCCTEEFVFRAVLDETYDMEFEFFLYAEFDEYLCGKASGETTRAVAEFIALERQWWERHCHDNKTAAHRFVMGHMNPVYCTSWIALFHQGDPNRSFFSCKEAHAHERQEKAARLAAEREKAAAAAKVAGPPEPQAPPGADTAIDHEEEERPDSSPVVRLPRTCFDQFDDDEPREQQVPLLNITRPCSLPTCTRS